METITGSDTMIQLKFGQNYCNTCLYYNPQSMRNNWDGCKLHGTIVLPYSHACKNYENNGDD